MMQPGRQPASVRVWVGRWWRGEAAPFWRRAVDLALAPAELLFRGVVAARDIGYRRGLLRSRAAPVPVVSIGNLTVGGAGKTPITAWAVDLLRSWGCRPAIVLRGYGADEVEVHRELNPGVPVVVAPRRWEGAMRAAAAGADCVVVDDGFQHRALRRDLDIVLVSAEHWRGNRRMLPRGPWREPIAALARGDRIVVTRKTASEAEAAAVAAEIADLGFTRPAIAALRADHIYPLTAGLYGAPEGLESLRGREVLAVTTLADPGPVLTSLDRAGALVHPLTFPDHHEFTDRDLAMIRTSAQNRAIVMTRKEAVKLRGRLVDGRPAYVIDLRVTVEQGERELVEALRGVLKNIE